MPLSGFGKLEACRGLTMKYFRRSKKEPWNMWIKHLMVCANGMGNFNHSCILF